MAAASGTTYVARGIYGHPGATALTIAPDGRIQAIGSTPPDDTTIDRRWAEAWLYPGFIEAHSHPDTGWLWGAGAYLGAIERRTPGGGTDAGCHSIEQVLSRLQAARDSTDETTPILAWGYDPWHVEGSPLDRRTLDQVSATRPVFVLHASQHVVSVNSAVIAMDALDTNPTPGIQRDPAGKPTGILAEPEAILATAIARAALAGEFQPSALQQFGVEASHAGYTTATDLDTTALLRPDSADAYASTVNAPEFPVRLAAFCHIDTSSEQQLAASIQAARNARQLGTAKLRTGFAKLFLDGSIQAETAKLTHPYLDAGTGQWLTEPARFASILAELDTAGLTVHTHGNGDAAARAFADALNALPLPAGHQYQRHALTHAQLADDATLTRIRDAGGTVSFLINHIRWWGDAEADHILGAERAARLDPAASAERLGLAYSLHSDSPVTPIDPLELIANAIDRRTESVRALGPDQRITASQAINAITRSAAWQLGMESEVGELALGMRADVTAADRNLTACRAGDEVRAARILGTMLDGTPTSTL